MEYLKNHKKITQSAFNDTIIDIIDRLKKEFEQGKMGKTAIKDVSDQIYHDFIKNNVIEKYRPYFDESKNAIIAHRQNYNSKKVDSILKTLENKVHENYVTTIKTFQIHNLGESDIKDMLYEEFYQQLLKYIVFNQCRDRLKSTIEYLPETIELLYDLNNYEDFPNLLLENDEREFTYDSLNKIFLKYNKRLPRKKKVNNFAENESTNKFVLKYKNQIDKFNDDEKCFLIHFVINEKYKLPFTEKIKLIVIAGNFNDYRIFEELPSKNDIYNRVQKGQKYIKSETNKKEIIAGLIEKLEIFKLTKTIDLLNYL